MTSPTQRSLEYLRDQGNLVAVVERSNPHARIRQDLFSKNVAGNFLMHANPEHAERMTKMSKAITDTAEDQLTVEQWLEIRKDAGLRIDPETAEVTWSYEQTLDPYGVYSDLPDECYQVGREYFARSPGSDIWVLFDDLPDETRKRLWDLHRSKLAFPAGLRFFAGDLPDK